MSIFGSNFGAGFGDVDNHLIDIKLENNVLYFLPADGFGDMYYGIYVNSVFTQSIYVNEGQYSPRTNIEGPDGSIILILGLGQIDANPNTNQIDVLNPPVQFVNSVWNWTIDTIDPPDFDIVYDVVLYNVKRSQVLVGDQITRGSMTFEAIRDVDDVTINVYDKTGLLACSGDVLISGATNIVNLSEENDSGITGSLTITNESFTDINTEIEIRWARRMNIYRGTSDPASTLVASVLYDGNDTGTWTEPDKLDVGVYYYALAALSDTDDIGDKSASTLIDIEGVPESVSNLQYVSGDYSDTLVSFTPSSTVGSTYNVYLKEPSDLNFDTNVPVQTLVAGSTETTLPILEYPGIVSVLIRAEYNGFEEQNSEILDIEYDAAGERVVERPNIPEIRDVSVSNGDNVTCVIDYDSTDEVGVATSVELYARLYDDTYDLSNPVAVGTFTSYGAIRTATVSFTAPTEDTYYYACRAVTDEGGYSISISREEELFVSDVNLPSPQGSFTVG